MPFVVPFSFERLSEKEFRQIDYEVTAQAFRVHREFGPHFFSEDVYRDEIAYRCRQDGVGHAATDVPRYGPLSAVSRRATSLTSS